ncbi:MAG: sigma-70 family RNA polymerase sigma factor [Hyphomonadaceae bacterium]|nr:sigma-70 family RNA polymerase sigma factor [Hyphomonadaceae bacterium]
MTASEPRLKALMIQGLEGDAAAHNRLLGELARMLRSYYAKRMAGLTADIEDLVQETLIAVHTRRESYDRNRAFTAWAFSIARYKMVDAFRSRGTRVAIPIEDIDDLFADDASDGIAAGVAIERLMAELPANQRLSIQHTKIEGLSVEETANRTGLSASNVKISVHRGLKALMARVRKGDADAN